MKKIFTVLTAIALTIGGAAVAAPAQALEQGVTVEAQTRVIAGDAYLAVRVTNGSSETLRARVEAPVVTEVKTATPGKNATWTIKLRDEVSGTAEVVVQQFTGGRLVKETFLIDYDAS